MQIVVRHCLAVYVPLLHVHSLYMYVQTSLHYKHMLVYEQNRVLLPEAYKLINPWSYQVKL